MKKHIYSVIALVFCLVILSLGVCAAKPFGDVPTTHWAYKYVNPMVEKGVVNGYDGNVFKPNGVVTRAEWAKLLTVTANIPIHEDFAEIIENACFDAKPTSWHAAYTVALLPYFDYSFSEGDNGELYFACEASKPATRLEIAKSIVRVAGYEKLTPNYALIKGFRDYSKIPEDDRKYIAIAVQKGIVAGFDDNTFRPFDNVTRAQAVTMLYRTFIGEEVVVEQPEKPYIIDKFADASIEHSKEATLDESGNFYFIDNTDNRVYVVNVKTKERELYCDPNEITFNDGDNQYSNYLATQVFYDKENDILVLNGHFQSLRSPGKTPSKSEKYTILYDITDGKCEMLCEPQHSWQGTNSIILQSTFSKDTYLIYSYNGYETIDIHTGSKKSDYRSFSNSGNCSQKNNVVAHKYANNIYLFAHKEYKNFSNYGFSSVYKYNFSESKFEYLVDNSTTLRNCGMGMLDGYYYFYFGDKETMYKINLKTAMVDEVGITFSEKLVEYADMGSLKNINTYFYFVDEDTLIFYDYNMEAFRILSENKIEIEEFVPPTFNVAAYYTFLKKFDASKYEG